MDIKKYKQVRVLVAFFVGLIVSIASTRKSYLLASAGVFTGLLFMIIVRSKTKFKVDERERSVREKAAQLTYSVFAPTIGIGSFLMIAFARGEFLYLESLGMVFAYLTLFLITLYAISYYFYNKIYGGGGDEE